MILMLICICQMMSWTLSVIEMNMQSPPSPVAPGLDLEMIEVRVGEE